MNSATYWRFLTILFVDDCVLRYDRDHPAVFIRKVREKHLVITRNEGEIEIEDGDSIEGYCTSGFR